MQNIILTKYFCQGQRLSKDLIHFSSEFEGIDIYTKENILSSPSQFKNVECIFSTWYMPFFTTEEIRNFFPSLKALFYSAGSVKYFAEPFIKSGVSVFNAAPANAKAVADFVVAQILLANKGYYQAQAANKSILWRWAFNRAKKYSESRKGNYGARVGLIGCGNIGSEVAKLLSPYNLEIVVHDPYISEKRCLELGVKNIDLATLFETCDVISNHLPNIPATRNIINYDLLSRMKDHATFINTGRGEQVVESDLAKILKKRPTICALLDVVRHETLRPWSPLLRRKNVFVSPHIAGSTGEETLRMVGYIVCVYNNFKKGQPVASSEIQLSDLDKKA